MVCAHLSQYPFMVHPSVYSCYKEFREKWYILKNLLVGNSLVVALLKYF